VQREDIKEKNAFYTRNLPADQRIGPHPLEVLSLIYGALLGDAFAERHGKGVRICFHQRKRNIAYLFQLRQILGRYGYVNLKSKPKVRKQIGKKGKIYYSIKFSTWTFTSFENIWQDWYSTGQKSLPHNLKIFLTPLALAAWARDDDHFTGSGMLLWTDSFRHKEVFYLSILLFEKFGISSTLRYQNQKYWRLYISPASMIHWCNLVAPYAFPQKKSNIS